MPAIADQKRLLTHYFFLTYLVVLLITMDSVGFKAAFASGWPTLLFVMVAFLCYGAYYLLPAILLTSLVQYVSNLGNRGSGRNTPANIAAVVTGGVTTLLMYANVKIFSLYGMFFNGFIMNLVITPGGIQSLGGSSSSDIGFVMIAAGFIALQGLLLWLARVFYFRTHHALLLRLRVFSIIAVLLGTLGIHFSYAANDAFGKNNLASVAETVPFFQPVTARHFFARLGYEIKRGPKLDVEGRLNYPLKPLEISAPAKPYNIVWLTSESWRADMLDQEIMPNTWKFSDRALRFTDNYSGGNGTRMGVFSMFTGLPGNYWFSFLNEQRGAAIVDVLQRQNYQMQLYTSARFSYPEFDKTIFSQISAQQLHSLDDGRQGWQRDRSNVTSMLKFIDQRDQARPFFAFMFFESPHARYFFPQESVIRQPYRDDINYASMSKGDLRRDIVGIKNRYINAVHHLDSQFGRVFDYLEQNGLLENTIVVVVGDHGEEFMEHGFWGHNSTFVDQQVRTPLVIYIPGQQPRVYSGMTSHMDIVPTLMPLLGVANPAEDYSEGNSLLASPSRTHTYVSDWSRITYVDHEVKITQPFNVSGFSANRITAANDEPLPLEQVSQAMQRKQQPLLQLAQDAGKFLKK